MKKYIVYAGAGLVILIALIAFGRACKLDDKYSRLEGRYQEARRIAKIDSEILNATIAEKERAIAALDKKLATSEQVVGQMTNAIGQKDSDLADLDARLAAAQTDAERVPILTAQVKTWSEKFSLAEQTIAEKDKQIAAWKTKFSSQVTISESWKQKYENEARLHGLSRDELSALKNKLGATRLMGTIKSGLVLASYVSNDQGEIMNPFFSHEERIRRCIAKHPDWSDVRVQNSVKGPMDPIKAVRAGLPLTLQTGESKPLEGNGNVALVSLDKVIARYDIKAAILREIGALPKGKLIVEAELCQRTAGRDRNRFRRTCDNNAEEFKAFRINLRLDDGGEGKWFWGKQADITVATQIVNL